MLLVSVRYGAAYHTQRSPIDSNVYIAHQNWNSVALINDFAVGLDVIVLWRLCTTDQFGCTIGNAADGEYGVANVWLWVLSNGPSGSTVARVSQFLKRTKFDYVSDPGFNN